MTTIFMTAPFRRFDLGNHVRVTPAGYPRLGQTARSVVTNILEEIGITEADISDLLNKIPAEAAGPYRAQFEDCKKKGLTTSEGAACAYALYQAIKAGTPVTPAVPAPAAQQASTFPIIPVVLAVAATGALVYFITR
jgi:hypothetical protein